MKRFAWLLVAVFCTALAQVQPVDVVVQRKHDCCGGDCRCGVPACALPAPHSPVAYVSEREVAVARPEAKRADPRLGTFIEKFYASVAAPAVSREVRPAPWSGAPAASVPLFTAHCSFLI
jgi:hypothetical protein